MPILWYKFNADPHAYLYLVTSSFRQSTLQSFTNVFHLFIFMRISIIWTATIIAALIKLKNPKIYYNAPDILISSNF